MIPPEPDEASSCVLEMGTVPRAPQLQGDPLSRGVPQGSPGWMGHSQKQGGGRLKSDFSGQAFPVEKTSGTLPTLEL